MSGQPNRVKGMAHFVREQHQHIKQEGDSLVEYHGGHLEVIKEEVTVEVELFSDLDNFTDFTRNTKQEGTQQRIHTGDKLYSCDSCGKKFSQKSNLVVHQRSHSGVKTYTCDICNRNFTHISTLKTHQRTHTGEKPYHREYCSKKFTKKSNLVVHQRSHDKPYKCHLCDEYFKHITSLKTHQRTHTGEKQYLCNYCGKKFSSLKKHQLIHTNDKLYKCKQNKKRKYQKKRWGGQRGAKIRMSKLRSLKALKATRAGVLEGDDDGLSVPEGCVPPVPGGGVAPVPKDGAIPAAAPQLATDEDVVPPPHSARDISKP